MTANGATRTTEEPPVAHQGHLCQIKFGNGSDRTVGGTDQQGEYRAAEEKKWQTCQLPEMIRVDLVRFAIWTYRSTLKRNDERDAQDHECEHTLPIPRTAVSISANSSSSAAINFSTDNRPSENLAAKSFTGSFGSGEGPYSPYRRQDETFLTILRLTGAQTCGPERSDIGIRDLLRSGIGRR